MKILFLSQIVPYPPKGGALQRGYNLIREIHKYNKIYLMAFIHPEVLNNDTLIADSRRELEKFCERIEYFPLWPKKSKYHTYAGVLFSLFSKRPFCVFAYRSSSFKKCFLEIMRTEKIDLVHVDTIGLAQFNNETIHVSKVLTHHNIESILMKRRAEVEANPLARLYLSQEAKKLETYELQESPKFDANIMVSDIDKEELKKRVPDIKTAVIPNGVDTDYFHVQQTEGLPSLIYAGGMNMFANKDAVMYFLKEIWPRIKAERPDINFFAIGQDPPQDLLEIGRNDSNVHVTGYVDDVRPYIAKASVYVVPLRVGGGTRLKILDAMAMGKAIVSTSIGCEGINVKKGENILVADNPSEFANIVLELIDNPDRAKKLGEAARRLVESRYSWEIIGRKLQEVYEEIIK